MNRSSLYQESKNLANQLNLPLFIRWPAGSAVQWNNELNRLREVNRTTVLYDNERIPINEAYNRLLQIRTTQAFNNILNIINLRKQPMTREQAFQLYMNISSNPQRHTMSITTTDREFKIPINSTTQQFLIDLLSTGYIELIDRQQYGSDILDNINFQDITNLSVEIIQRPENEIKNRDARFFKYINTTDLDLSRYQIFNQQQASEISSLEHCLIHTLIESGISNTLVNNVKLAITTGGNFRKADLKIVSDIIRRNIILYQRDDRQIREIKIKSAISTGEDIHICIYENHYFIYEKTIYSIYSINNYEEVKDLDRFNDITGIRSDKKTTTYKRERNICKLNSLYLVDKLKKNILYKVI